MANGAPRLPWHKMHRIARGAFLAAFVWQGAAASEIESAAFEEPTELYGHLVLGKSHNWAALRIGLSDGSEQVLRLQGSVFEDTEPRLVDMDLDGAAEILTVESAPRVGARLVFYGLRDGEVTLLAATPFIGQTNRWYAPVGAFDLDGDGVVEFAFVDRPHLAKVLRVWRYVPQGDRVRLEETATFAQVTNHRIGEDWISGGIRRCGSAPEMILATGNWADMIAVAYEEGAWVKRVLGSSTARSEFDRVLACE